MNSGGMSETLGSSSAGTRSAYTSAELHATRRAPGLTSDLVMAGGANLMGADLYKHLQQYFISHLKQVREVRPTVPSCRDTRQKSLTILERHRLPQT